MWRRLQVSAVTRSRRQRTGCAMVFRGLEKGLAMTKQERRAEIAGHFYHIGDVALLTGLTADALRAWEQVGLLTPRRSTGGMRQFTEDDVARVRLIARTLQQGGLTRHAVAMLLQSGDLRPDAADYSPGPPPARRPPGRSRVAARQLSTSASDRTDERGEARSERRTLDAIARISDALASGRPLTEVLQVMCSETCRAFGVSDTVIWLIEPHPQSPDHWLITQPGADLPAQTPNPASRTPRALVVAATWGPHASAVPLRTDAHAKPLSVSLDDQRFPAVRAIHTRRGLIASELKTSPLDSPEIRAVLSGMAQLTMPLLNAGGEPVGALTLSHSHDADRFNEDDLERVRLFAVQATLAIETARLHGALQTVQRAAEEQRARWQATVDDLPVLVCVCDSALRLTYISPTCEQVLGWPSISADTVGASEPSDSPEAFAQQDRRAPLDLLMSWIAAHGFTWNSDQEDGVATATSGDLIEVLPLARAYREAQVTHDVGVRHRRPDGTERFIVWDAAPMYSSLGAELGAVAVGRDVTTERRQREREACLAAVTRAAAGAPTANGAEGRAARVLTALVARASAPVIAATLYLLDDESAGLRRVGAFGVERSGTHGPTLPLDNRHPWWRLLIAGPTYSTHDQERPRWLRTIGLDVWKASSIRAWATAPLRSGGTLVGAISIGLSVPHVWDAAERAWFEACADAVLLGVETDRLFAAEQQRSHALEAMLTTEAVATKNLFAGSEVAVTAQRREQGGRSSAPEVTDAR